MTAPTSSQPSRVPATTALRLSLAPIPYYWSREDIQDFYASIAETAIDVVYLGEVVCPKRKALRTIDWLAISEDLLEAGKEVVIATSASLESETDLRALRRLCDNGCFAVEANDMAAVQLLKGSCFIGGPGLNIYNHHSLRFLAGLGMVRWSMPIELGRDALAQLQSQRPPALETEVLVYGRLPLALSARCFTARHHDLSKEHCGHRCADDPDGLLVQSQDGTPVLALNGLQVQSARTYNLVQALGDLAAMAVDIIRISPQFHDTLEVVDVFDRCRRGEITSQQAAHVLEGLTPVGGCSGFWWGEPGHANVA